MKEIEVKGRQIGNGQPLICVPVMEREKNDIIAEITYLEDSCADMIEWRVDAFADFRDYNKMRTVLEAISGIVKDKIFLYTFRSVKQGGENQIDKQTLEDLHDLAIEAGCVDFIDLEYFEEDRPTKKIRKIQEAGVKIIASHHDFEETPAPEVMKMLLERMCAGGADIVKLAVMPRNEKDVLNLLEVTAAFRRENPDTPAITMSMGKRGCISRLSGESFGSCVTFGAHKKASAPGQFEMNELKQILEIIHKS